MIQLVEIYFKDNTKESFFADKVSTANSKIKIFHGGKETVISLDDIKYHSIEKQENEL